MSITFQVKLINKNNNKITCQTTNASSAEKLQKTLSWKRDLSVPNAEAKFSTSLGQKLRK